MSLGGGQAGAASDVAGALERLTAACAQLRGELGADALVVARASSMASELEGISDPAPIDFVVVTACGGPDADPRVVPAAGTLIPSSPFLQTVVASAAPHLRRVDQGPDVVMEAFFPALPQAIGQRLSNEFDATVGVLLAAGDGLGGSAANELELGARAISSALSEALDQLTSESPDARRSEVAQLRRRLEQSEARYRRFIGSSSESIWCLEPPSPFPDSAATSGWTHLLAHARFVEANHTFARRFGFASPGDVIGKTVAELSGFWLLQDDARLGALATGGFNAEGVQATEHDATGRSRTLSSSLFGTSDARGLRSLWAIERDVTAQVEEDRLLRESAEFYRAISRTALDGICVLDANLEVLDCNDAFMDLLAIGDGLQLEAGDVPIVPATDATGTAEWFEQMSDAGTWRGEARLRRVDLTFVPIELACRVTDAGSPRRYYCFVRDLSERKTAEKRESEHNHELAHAARLSTLGEMTSGLAHELNQPLAAIVNYAGGCLRLLERHEFEDPLVLKALRSIVDQSGRAAEIIRRMRTFARRETDRREAFSIAEVLREALSLADQDLSRSGVIVTTEFAADPDDVVVDGIQIEQVALNLIRNALEAFERDTSGQAQRIALRTSLPPSDALSPVFVQVTLEDNGPGIPTGDSGQVFDPFFTTRTPGIGLGLTVSRSIVEAHGGRLWLEPTHVGARFCFTIPLRNAPIRT